MRAKKKTKILLFASLFPARVFLPLHTLLQKWGACMSPSILNALCNHHSFLKGRPMNGVAEKMACQTDGRIKVTLRLLTAPVQTSFLSQTIFCASPSPARPPWVAVVHRGICRQIHARAFRTLLFSAIQILLPRWVQVLNNYPKIWQQQSTTLHSSGDKNNHQ